MNLHHPTNPAVVCLFPVVPAMLLFGAVHAGFAASEVAFPNDPSVLDVRRDFGAVGDGVADDTAALQAGFDASSNRGTGAGTKVLFIPNGTYRVTSNVLVRASVGPWVYGESRDGVVIRLDDGASTNVTSVIRTHPSDTNPGSADWFMRNLRNLTVDVGNNPGVDGIRWFGNNSSLLKNVRVTGNGRYGVNPAFLGQNGPNLIQDVTVDGSFETGFRCAWSWGQTLSRVTVRNARREAVYVQATAIGLEDLVTENCPIAIRNEDYPPFGGWNGVIALVGGRFTGGDPAQPAITNRGVLYARDVTASGFQKILHSTTSAGSVNGTNITEYISGSVRKLFTDSPNAALKLPIKREPDFPWEMNPAKWICANNYGATFGDNTDDTAAVQAAIDAAAAAGATVVYFRGISGGDPNWYNIRGEVRIRGSVRHIIGLGFGRILNNGTGRFIVDDNSAPLVKFQHIQGFGGASPTIENRSATNTVFVESCDAKILGTGGGDIFVTDCPSHIELRSPTQSVWARQLNPEGSSDTGIVRNHGGRLWCLGVKHEGAGVRFLTDNGGQTEILGLFNYGPGIAADDRRPQFDIDNSPFTAMGVREISFGNTWPVKAREIRDGVVRTENGGGWIGWALYSGWKPEQTNGPVAVAWPRLSPPGGTFAAPLNVSAVTTTTNAELRHTIDGSEPSAQSPLLPVPLVLSNSTHLRVKGFKAGVAPSAVASGLFLREERTQLLSITNLWRYNQTDDFTADTNWFRPGYNDSAWPAGRALLHAETVALPAPKNTALTLGRMTYYFRTTFVAPSNLVPLTLTASNLIDDGAVFYLNGVEVRRVRMDSGAVTYSTPANAQPAGGDATVWDVFTIPTNALVAGTNLLAVEVHQASTNSSDIVFGCTLWLGAQRGPAITNPPVGRVVRPGDRASLGVGADGSPPLFYQWRRNGADIPGANGPVLDLPAVSANDLGAYSVLVSNFVGSAVSSSAAIGLDPVGPPALLAATFNSAFSQITLTFHKPVTAATATDLAHYELTGPAGHVAILGATQINGTNVVLTLAPQTSGDFVVAVARIADVSGQAIAPGSRATVGYRRALVPISATWKYEQSASDLGTDWREPAFDDSPWPAGAALLARETGALPEPVRTTLTTNTGKITFYFRHRFMLPSVPANSSLLLRQIIDDGVAFHLNGRLLSRTRLAADAEFNTLADNQPTDPAPYEGPFTLPASALLAGNNLLAAEVHQSSDTSSDVVFGAELTLDVASAALPHIEPYLNIERMGAAQLILRWTGGPAELEQSPEVAGPWSRATNQSNPQAVPPTNTAFFRLRL